MRPRKGSGKDAVPQGSTHHRSRPSGPFGSGGGSTIIGRSAPIQERLRQIQLVAPTEATVLIRGERGTEKELVADAIQQGSLRTGQPYRKLNCAALPSELLVSELFGHERGAFTGALQRKPGFLTLADGGTLFLDEVGDLSREAQAMLLRFLDQREVRPLGSTETFRVDVRLIAATNKDLEVAIRQKEFRANLYDRLSEVVLEVPPLRERREDIPLLVEHFLALYGWRHRVSIQGVKPQALERLQSHSWPGNVRELEKTVSRAVVFAEAGWIRPQDLGLLATDEATTPPLAGGSPSDEDGAAFPPLNLRQQEALGIASLRGAVRRADLVARFGISEGTAKRDLAALVQGGFLSRSGAGRGSRYQNAR
ncbi:MAG: sigma 54-interacting transcriptional regulator [Acidobacteriota bacterium]